MTCKQDPERVSRGGPFGQREPHIQARVRNKAGMAERQMIVGELQRLAGSAWCACSVVPGSGGGNPQGGSKTGFFEMALGDSE